MSKTSAGLLLYRRAGGRIEVLLVHPGGPYWAKQDAGAWSIPKGEVGAGEDPVAGEWDPAHLRSNTFSLEWPPRSGRRQEFPEVDRAAWFTLPEAHRRIGTGQAGFLDELAALLASEQGSGEARA